MKKTKHILAIASIAIIAVAAVAFSGMRKGEVKQANAQSAAGNVSGYAWSSNVGWISFNCSNTNTCDTALYGVNISTANGTITGYAWSSNIGWISFNETTGCPSGTCGAYVENVPASMTGYKAVKGWAKAVTGGGTNSGGWDGWIKLDHNQANPVTYSFENKEFRGYAWGGPVTVGWISFNSSNTGTTPAYSVVGPGMSSSTLSTLGPVTTAPLCDVSKVSYLEVSALTNGNNAPNISYTAYPVSSTNVVGAALPAGSLYNNGSKIIFRDYSATSSVSKKYAIYARSSSPAMSTSTATSSLVAMPAGFTCVVPDPNLGSVFTSETFVINPDIATPPETCLGSWSASHNGSTTAVEAVCTISPSNGVAQPVSPVGTGPVNYGANTFRCSLRNIDAPATIYDSIAITRRCFRNADVIER